MISLPEFPNCENLDFSHQRIISELLQKKGINSSDFAFYNLMGWYLTYPPMISRIGSHLIIKVEGPKNSCVVLPPLGEGKIGEPLRLLLDQMPKLGCPRVLSYVPKPILGEILAEFPDVKIEPQREDFDYLYTRKELAELSGRKFHQKKNFVNRVQEDHFPVVDRIDSGNTCDALKFLECWYSENQADDLSMKIEALAASRILPHLEKIGGLGILVKIDDKIEGMSVATPVNGYCWVVGIEKANKTIKGLYQFVNWAMANNLPEVVSLINRETDLGIEGLRTAKQSYHPVALEEKFRLTF